MRRSIGKSIRRHKSSILTFAGAIGTVAATITAVTGTIKATNRINEIQEDGTLLSTKAKIKVAAPAYILPASLCFGSVVCIFGSHYISKKEKAALIGSCAAIGSAFGEYKDEIVDLIGEEDEEKIRNKIVENKTANLPRPKDPEQVLFYDEFTGEHFYSTLMNIYDAQKKIFDAFQLNGEVSIQEIYYYFGQKMKDNDNHFRLFGWNDFYLHDEGSDWVGIDLRCVTTKDKTTYVISYSVEPILYYWCYEPKEDRIEEEEDINEHIVVS